MMRIKMPSFTLTFPNSRCDKLEWYLLFKPFVIETDHNNLRWLEQTAVAKLVRWRLYIQQFHTMVKHVAGAAN